jgi:hypothetical protein
MKVGETLAKVSERMSRIMRFRQHLALAVVLMASVEAILPSALADPLPARLTQDITDVVVYDGGRTRRAVCGNVSARKEGGGYTDFQPFRILTRAGGGIADPLSFLVGTDPLTMRRVVFMCSNDRDGDQH